MSKLISIEFKQGAAWRATIQIRAKSGVRPIEGYQAYMQVRENPDAPILVDASTENGLITVDVINNVFAIAIPAAITKTLRFKRAEYDLFIVPPNADPERILFGSATVIRSITQL